MTNYFNWSVNMWVNQLFNIWILKLNKLDFSWIALYMTRPCHCAFMLTFHNDEVFPSAATWTLRPPPRCDDKGNTLFSDPPCCLAHAVWGKLTNGNSCCSRWTKGRPVARPNCARWQLSRPCRRPRVEWGRWEAWLPLHFLPSLLTMEVPSHVTSGISPAAATRNLSGSGMRSEGRRGGGFAPPHGRHSGDIWIHAVVTGIRRCTSWGDDLCSAQRKRRESNGFLLRCKKIFFVLLHFSDSKFSAWKEMVFAGMSSNRKSRLDYTSFQKLHFFFALLTIALTLLR